ncbi:hypothetical protein A4T48_01290 [Escherichia coli]|nr:hypothetical protein A4T44_01280 [Escherichia coli]ORD61746.1 hypothetical protein A4T48_01290 [Escherichia coli]ORD89766.1 hypothetical protein A4T56_01290 [Escherichia coli]
MSLALTGHRYTVFKSVPDRFVTHPSHLLNVSSWGLIQLPSRCILNDFVYRLCHPSRRVKVAGRAPRH